MFNQVLIIPNPGSGKGKAVQYAEQLRDLLIETHQSEVEVRPTEKVGDAENWAAEAHSEGFDLVVCLGGDGTVRETVNGLLKNEKVPYFGFVPLGTVNDLGRALGYDMNPEKAVEQYRHTKVVPLDIGEINKKIHFINVLAIGALSESVMHTASEDKNKLGFFAYLKDGIKAYFKQERYELVIETGSGETFELETDLLLLSMTNSIGGYEAMVPHAKYDDGLIHLLSPKTSLAVAPIKTLFEGGVPSSETDDLLVLNDSEFTITCKTKSDIETNIDGDEGPVLPIHVKVLPSALQVVVPE